MKLRDELLGDFRVAGKHHLTGFLIDNILCQRGTNEELVVHNQLGQLGCLHLANMARSNTPPFFDYELALLVCNRKCENLTTQTCWYQLQRDMRLFTFLYLKSIVLIEHFQNFLGAETKRAQQDGSRQFATAVDSHIHHILGIELEIQPGTTVRNNPCRIQQLARTVGLATVVVEEYTRRTMQL